MKRKVGVVLIALAILGVVAAVVWPRDESPDAATNGTLVTLGDSYASGEGLAPYEPASDTADNTCHRSEQAFTKKVAKDADLKPVNVSCSGAKIGALTQGFKTEPAQLSRVKGASAVVTMIGGNDVDALSYVSDPTAIAQFEQRLPALDTELRAAFAQIRQESGSVPFLVVGYPSPVSNSQSRAEGCPFTPEQVNALSTGARKLNSTIREAALSQGARFVDTTNAFQNHGFCDSTPWVNGLRLDNIQASLHPTPEGQERLADLVSQSLSRV